MSLGITLVGHQKKIMSSIQTMRAQMLHLHGTGVQVWRSLTGCLRRGREQNLTWDINGIIVKANRRMMSDSSGCAWSEIIPLFLSEWLWSASLKGTKERKRAKNGNKKETTWMRHVFFPSFCRSAYKLNHISNSALERSLPLIFLFMCTRCLRISFIRTTTPWSGFSWGFFFFVFLCVCHDDTFWHI